MSETAPLLVSSKNTAVGFWGTRVHINSLVSVKVTGVCNGNEIGAATGFFIQDQSKISLISNWHVFSGRCARCGQPLNSQAATPDTIRVKVHNKKLSIQGQTPAEYVIIDIPIYNNEKPVWKQTLHGQQIDLAGVQIDNISADILIAPINLDSSKENKPMPTDTDFLVGNDIYIVGFPDKIETALDLPIWKRGTIASETLAIDGKTGEFFVDASTRKGMSGSPVYTCRKGGLDVLDGRLIKKEELYIPVGVYSGRISTSDRFGAEIGMVWPMGFIQEIIENNYPGSFILNKNVNPP